MRRLATCLSTRLLRRQLYTTHARPVTCLRRVANMTSATQPFPPPTTLQLFPQQLPVCFHHPKAQLHINAGTRFAPKHKFDMDVYVFDEDGTDLGEMSLRQAKKYAAAKDRLVGNTMQRKGKLDVVKIVDAIQHQILEEREVNMRVKKVFEKKKTMPKNFGVNCTIDDRALDMKLKAMRKHLEKGKAITVNITNKTSDRTVRLPNFDSVSNSRKRVFLTEIFLGTDLGVGRSLCVIVTLLPGTQASSGRREFHHHPGRGSVKPVCSIAVS